MKRMEKPSENSEEFTGKIVKEAGLEKAPVGLYERIMNTIDLIPVGPFIYKPLISKRGWWMIAIGSLLIVALLIFMPWGEATYSQQLRDSVDFSWENPFSGLAVSNTTIYAVLGMALFFLQIPLLKRLLDNRFKDQ